VCRFASLPDYHSFSFFPTLRISSSTDSTELLKFIGMKPGVLNCGFLFPKCAKTHLQASALSKIFPGVIPLVKGEGIGREVEIGVPCQNLDSQNLYSQNLDSQNLDSQHLDSQCI
jgi:hypothetical protein